MIKIYSILIIVLCGAIAHGQEAAQMSLAELRKLRKDIMIDGDKVAKVTTKNINKVDKKARQVIDELNDPEKKKRKWGIASTTVSYALKIRTIVRYTYEEIKLWQGVVQKYNDIRKWLDKMGKETKKFGGNIDKFFTQSDDPIAKLRQLVGIYDQADYLMTMPKTLDQKVAALERAYDKLVIDTFTYKVGPFSSTIGWTPGALIPNTAETFKWLDNQLMDNKYFNTMARWSDSLETSWRGEAWNPILTHGDKPTVPDITIGEDPLRRYTQPIISNQIVISSAISNSIEYRKWAQKATQELSKVDKQLETIEKNLRSKGDSAGITSREFAGVWYSIENVNATNKTLRHSIEEAKLQQAILATDVHTRTDTRVQQLNYTIQNFIPER